MNDDEMRALIHHYFREELGASMDEYRCVERNDHQGAADAHRRRVDMLNRAGQMIERLKETRP